VAERRRRAIVAIDDAGELRGVRFRIGEERLEAASTTAMLISPSPGYAARARR
jgi:hypothetical protein